MIINPTAPGGYTVFCDDIRRELNNKLTLVGVYSGALVIQAQLPTVLPRLSFLVTYFDEIADSHQSVDLQIFMPGDADDSPSIVQNLRTANAKALDFPRPLPAPSGSHFFAVSRGIVEISPFPITEEGWLRVRAIRGDDEIRVGALQVSVLPPDTDEPEAA